MIVTVAALICGGCLGGMFGYGVAKLEDADRRAAPTPKSPRAEPALTGTPSEMVGRVARAIYNATQGPWTGAQWEDAEHGEHLRQARAAIEAMREPTEAQYDALSATGVMWRDQTSTSVWQTYIDAAILDPVKARSKASMAIWKAIRILSDNRLHEATRIVDVRDLLIALDSEGQNP